MTCTRTFWTLARETSRLTLSGIVIAAVAAATVGCGGPAAPSPLPPIAGDPPTISCPIVPPTESLDGSEVQSAFRLRPSSMAPRR